ncbi:MAG: hypothetical protein WA160_14355 [Pseudobdellovibrio sp.]
MKTNNLLTVLLISCLTSISAAEQMSAAQGLEKIKTNLENSKANQKEYERNLDVVSQNLNEVTKAKSSVIKQKETVSSEILKNNDALRKSLVQERDLNTLIAQEKEKFQIETKQLEQLEKMIAQIKQNQVQREALLSDYQNQFRLANEEKKAWKDRETELRAQEAKTIQTARSLASEEATWSNKKKGYEGETKRWAAESEKQQRIHDTYQGLAEQK